MKRHIFLSYSTKDELTVRKLHKRLARAGFDIWIDKERIDGADQLSDTIRTAIQKSHAVIFALSPNTMHSDWVKQEIEVVLQLGLPCFPLIIDGNPTTALPDLFKDIHYIVCTGSDRRTGYRSIVRSLLAASGITRRLTSLQILVASFLVLLLVTVILSLSFVSLELIRVSRPQIDNLSMYTQLSYVADDLDGSDFGWESGNSDQSTNPELVDSIVGDIEGTFVAFPVVLRSETDASGYSAPDLQARVQRRMRNVERTDLNALLATVYIQSDRSSQVSVVPYFEISGYRTVFLGFGQVIQTNQWSLIMWRDITDSNRYTPNFFAGLTALRDEYDIQDLGYVRMTHVLALPRPDGSYLGMNFRFLSDQPEGVKDTLSGTIYISSVTLLP